MLVARSHSRNGDGTVDIQQADIRRIVVRQRDVPTRIEHDLLCWIGGEIEDSGPRAVEIELLDADHAPTGWVNRSTVRLAGEPAGRFFGVLPFSMEIDEPARFTFVMRVGNQRLATCDLEVLISDDGS